MKFPTGKELQEEGMQRAIDTTEKLIPEWSDFAYQYLQQYCREHPGQEILGEDVRAASIGIVPEPKSNRAWGAIFSRGARSGLLDHVGYKPVKNPRGHCGLTRIWIPKSI
jgi:hypothetical protein